MSMLNIDEVARPPLVTDEGTRSFIPLGKYLKASVLPADDPSQEHDWYPLFVSYQRELDVKRELESKNFDTFLPMVVKFKRINNKIERYEAPAIHNLIFVRSYYERIRWMKMFNRVCTSMQFTTRGFQTVKDTIIPLAQMERFIHASQEAEGKERVLYLRPEEIAEFKGRTVKFVKGDFEGIEGYIQRVNKNRMVIVSLRNVLSIALPVYRRDELVFL